MKNLIIIMLCIGFCNAQSTIALAGGQYQLTWSIETQGGGFVTSQSYSLYQSIGIKSFGQMSSQSFSITSQPVGTTDVKENNANTPKSFIVDQNYPNPFNPTTMIAFELPSRAKIEVTIYNILGKKVRTLVNSEYGIGSHKIEWNAKNNFGQGVSTGTYIFLIKASAQGKALFQEAKKMLLVR